MRCALDRKQNFTSCYSSHLLKLICSCSSGVHVPTLCIWLEQWPQRLWNTLHNNLTLSLRTILLRTCPQCKSQIAIEDNMTLNSRPIRKLQVLIYIQCPPNVTKNIWWTLRHICNHLTYCFSIMTAPTFSLTVYMRLLSLWLHEGLHLYAKILQTRANRRQLAELNRTLLI